MPGVDYCPIEKCRAKGGPTACRYHIPILLGNASARVDLAINDSEREYFHKQFVKLREQIGLHKKAKAYHRTIKKHMDNLIKNGTQQTHKNVPKELSFGSNSAPVLRECSLPVTTQRQLQHLGLGAPTLYELDAKNGGAKAFHDIMEKTREGNRHAAAVYVYPEEEYKDMKLFTSKDGTAGYALKWQEDEKAYDIVSVFSMKKKPYWTPEDRDVDKFVASKPVGQSIMMNAVANGGRILDCYDTVLPSLYSSVGFHQTDFDEWDDQYRPDDWDESAFANWNDGKPGVTYMRFDPYDYNDYESPALNERIYDGTLVTESREDIARKAAMRKYVIEHRQEIFAAENEKRKATLKRYKTAQQAERALERSRHPYPAGKGRTVVRNADGKRITSNDVKNIAHEMTTLPGWYTDIHPCIVPSTASDGSTTWRVYVESTDQMADYLANGVDMTGEQVFTDKKSASTYFVALKRGMERETYAERKKKQIEESPYKGPGRFKYDAMGNRLNFFS